MNEWREDDTIVINVTKAFQERTLWIIMSKEYMRKWDTIVIFVTRSFHRRWRECPLQLWEVWQELLSEDKFKPTYSKDSWEDSISKCLWYMWRKLCYEAIFDQSYQKGAIQLWEMWQKFCLEERFECTYGMFNLIVMSATQLFHISTSWVII